MAAAQRIMRRVIPLFMAESKKTVSLEAPAAVVKSICRELLPGWETTTDAEIEVGVISGGITNVLLKAQAPSTAPVLVRVYGKYTENMIDRELEMKHMRMLHKHGFGAQILGKFANGRLESFFDCRPLEPDEMGHPDIIERIAKRLADFHNIENGETKERRLFNTLHDWMHKAEEITFTDEHKQSFFTQQFNLSALKKDLTRMEQKFGNHASPVVFGHLDLLSGNILLLKEEGKKLTLRDSPMTFIDFEYTSQSYRGFDIGNHFNEYAGFDGDFDSSYPSVEKQRQFLAAYLNHSAGRGNVADHPTVDSLLEEVKQFSVISHFYWGIWSIIQARYSAIDFDFLSYSNVRLQHFLKGCAIVDLDKEES